MRLVPMRKHENPDPVQPLCGRLHEDWPDGVDEALALAGEVLLVAGWKVNHGNRIVLPGCVGESGPRGAKTAPSANIILPGTANGRKGAS
jgi:hypothetical protein